VLSYATSKLPITTLLVVEILDRIESVVTTLGIPCASSLESDLSQGEVSMEFGNSTLTLRKIRPATTLPGLRWQLGEFRKFEGKQSNLAERHVK